MAIRKLQDVDCKNKIVVIREDFNVPMKDGKITNDKRIRAALPTIRTALDKGAGVVLLSHLGRPTEGEYEEKFSLKPVAAHLGELLGRNVRLVARPEDAKAAPGEIVLVENIRFFKGEKKNADELAANLAALGDVYVMDAFGAAQAFLMVGGTTSSVQSMVLATCKRGDEIILPRNVHKSVINALVLCGAVPVYVNPEVDQRLGISLGMRRNQIAKAIAEHPNAVAVLVNNPTYYGVCSDLRAIVRMAHEAGMRCLADEAHGTHFYFGGGLPMSAMAAGADMASVSMHKSGGSLTQSSLLLVGPDVHAGYVRQIINLTQTTSGSYLLMSSLDISRRNLALRGRKVFHQVADMAEYARQEINIVGGYYAFGRELMNGDSIFDFDTTKLSVHTLDIGLAGIEVYDILRDEYDIQIEFGDIGNILAYLSIGDRPQEVERLVSALAEIRRRYQKDRTGLLSQEYVEPEVVSSPQEAFYAEKVSLPLAEAKGRVCSEFVMCYPPGIPLLAPGERVTAEILEHIRYAKDKGCSMTGPEDPDLEYLNVLV